MDVPCPSCSSTDVYPFYKARNVPIHCVQLLWSREEAIAFPQGHIVLTFCRDCGFIYNSAFEHHLLHYSEGYESTQSFSSTFNNFARGLATHLIERYELYNKEIVEIGCGQGEFLTLLCELGGNWGVGFDPAYIPGRFVSKSKSPPTFIQDFYSEKYANYRSDIVICKMTLEHIPDTANFVTTVRRTVGNNGDTVVFFQVPEVRRILRKTAFWDINYEHCSYFSPGSLARLFHHSGFNVIDLWTDYDDQYLMIEAKPGFWWTEEHLPLVDDLEDLNALVQDFAQSVSEAIDFWKQRIEEMQSKKLRTVVWGGSSKTVSVLTTLQVGQAIEYVVDINPFKDGTFIPGSGQQVRLPSFLPEYEPDVVIVMNPIYLQEITEELTRLGLSPRVINFEVPETAKHSEV